MVAANGTLHAEIVRGQGYSKLAMQAMKSIASLRKDAAEQTKTLRQLQSTADFLTIKQLQESVEGLRTDLMPIKDISESLGGLKSDLAPIKDMKQVLDGVREQAKIGNQYFAEMVSLAENTVDMLTHFSDLDSPEDGD